MSDLDSIPAVIDQLCEMFDESVAALRSALARYLLRGERPDVEARARGLFAGLALEGSMLTNRSAWNRAYYGQEASPRQVVVAMQVHNPGADPLRAALIRFGARQ